MPPPVEKNVLALFAVSPAFGSASAGQCFVQLLSVLLPAAQSGQGQL